MYCNWKFLYLQCQTTIYVVKHVKTGHVSTYSLPMFMAHKFECHNMHCHETLFYYRHILTESLQKKHTSAKELQISIRIIEIKRKQQTRIMYSCNINTFLLLIDGLLFDMELWFVLT